MSVIRRKTTPFVSSAVETRRAGRPSNSLGTNGLWWRELISKRLHPFAIGGLVHQALKLSRIGDVDLEEPAGAFRVAIDQRRIVRERCIPLDDLAGDWRVNVRCRLDRFDDGGLVALVE